MHTRTTSLNAAALNGRGGWGERFFEHCVFLLTLIRTHVRARTWARVRTREKQIVVVSF
jgi:hypothetical protein